MSKTVDPEAGLQRRLLAISGVIVGVAFFNATATQFVAYRVGYHPAIGSPLLGHFYAPWRWIEWQQAAWATEAKRTFQIVDMGLFSATTAALLGGFAYSSSIRRRPRKHEGVHGTARSSLRPRLGEAACCLADPVIPTPERMLGAGPTRKAVPTTCATTAPST